jgi:hypothetical protein
MGIPSTNDRSFFSAHGISPDFMEQIDDRPAARDWALYLGTSATGWLIATLSFIGFEIPRLVSLDSWWKWIIAAPLLVAFSMAAALGFFVWLASIEQASSRVNAHLHGKLSTVFKQSRTIPDRFLIAANFLLFLPWIIALVGWGMSYGD